MMGARPGWGLGEANVSVANVKAFGPAEIKTSTAGVVAKFLSER